jgi:hypothetical protein
VATVEDVADHIESAVKRGYADRDVKKARRFE